MKKKIYKLGGKRRENYNNFNQTKSGVISLRKLRELWKKCEPYEIKGNTSYLVPMWEETVNKKKK